jgi:hypothetical protein
MPVIVVILVIDAGYSGQAVHLVEPGVVLPALPEGV